MEPSISIMASILQGPVTGPVPGGSKMPRCKAPEVLRREAYLARTLTDEGRGKRRRWAFFTRLSIDGCELALSRSANRANPIFGKFLEGRPCRDPAIGVPFLGIVDVTANSAFVFLHGLCPFLGESNLVREIYTRNAHEVQGVRLRVSGNRSFFPFWPATCHLSPRCQHGSIESLKRRLTTDSPGNRKCCAPQ